MEGSLNSMVRALGFVLLQGPTGKWKKSEMDG